MGFRTTGSLRLDEVATLPDCGSSRRRRPQPAFAVDKLAASGRATTFPPSINTSQQQITRHPFKMMGNQTLCALYVATAGLQGNALGSDEEEVVLLIYTIIDMTRNKVIGVQQYVVKPSSADINDNLLSDQLVQESFVTEEMVKTAGVSLETAIKQFDEYIRLLQIDPDSPLFKFITDGQLPLRQCLHPEACTKNITLPDYYCSFYDLRKHFRHFYNVPEDQEFKSVKDLVDYLGMPHELNSDLYIRCVQDMVNIILRLIADGHSFSNPETIQIKLEPGICSKDEEVDNNCVVRARGLPWQSSDQDIAKFFRGLNIVKGGVALCLSPQGRRNGEALVRFISQEHRDLALKRHKHHISDRYIEVYMATGTDFVMVAGGCNNEAQAFLKKGAQVIIRMRGLPYDCTAEEVLEFFDRGENRCTVMDGTDGVLFVKKPDGRATGDAFVLFAEDEVAPKALSKHRDLIGSRYIELFRSTTAEVQQVLNRSMDPKTFEVTPTPLPLPALPQPMPLLPQHVITSGTRKDCIRLRGLPYEAQVENILEFLGEHAKNIVFQGVHMVYNTQGQPSGEAFIQMDSESSAFITAQQKHHRYMFYGKKQRYIEVFQCSGDDMSMVLTGNYPTTAAVSAVSPVGKTLLSPGMSLPSATNTLAAETSPTAGTVPSAAAAVASPLEAAYDHLAVLQQNHAQMQQQQMVKQQQDIWLMNHLAAAQQQQQQQQTVAHAAVAQQHAAVLYQQQQQQQQHMLALATASFVAKNHSGAVPQPRAVWPPELVPNHAAVPLTSALLAQNNHKLATAAAYPSIFSPHLPPPHPMFYINIPPPQPQAAAAKLPQYAAAYQQYVTAVPQPHQQYVSAHPNAAVSAVAAAATTPVLNLKRSWEQAFPGNASVVGSATDANANLVKRQYGASVATSVSNSITAPVGQNHATYSVAGYPSTPAFYAPM